MTKSTSATIEKPRPKKHPVDEILPIPKLAVYGFQHVLTFYAGAVIVPILLANSIGLTTEQLIHLINADLFTCGIASIIQSVGFWKIGVRLPLLQGVTFTAVSSSVRVRRERPSSSAPTRWPATLVTPPDFWRNSK